MDIIKKTAGGGFPQGVLPDGAIVPITSILEGTLLATSGICDQVRLNRKALTAQYPSPSDASWFADGASPLQINPIYVPSLEELGYPATGGYLLKARIGVVGQDELNQNATMEVRLLRYDAGGDLEVVPGFTASHTFSTGPNDVLIMSDSKALEGGRPYVVDFRTTTEVVLQIRTFRINLEIVKG